MREQQTNWNFSSASSVFSNERKTQAGSATMTTNKSIKIIKRGERAAQEAAADAAVNEQKKGTHEAARDMVATVTEWVSEFQQKRRTETANALKTLFPDTTPQAS
jgi:uncharacterized membrane-anchored protein